jgi:hypothetical protein
VASSVEAPKVTKSSISQRLPRLSTSVWLILILALFLIAMVPLVTGYIEQVSEQAALQLQIDQVQSQINALKAKAASTSTATTEAARMKAEMEAAKSQDKSVSENPEVSQILMALAWDYDMTITSMTVTQTTTKVLGTDYPVLSYSLRVTGQVANFQNFLIAAGNRLPSCQFAGITITPASVEGELDTASISILVYCSN